MHYVIGHSSLTNGYHPNVLGALCTKRMDSQGNQQAQPENVTRDHSFFFEYTIVLSSALPLTSVISMPAFSL